MQGQFFWYDVMSTDVKAAAEFYATVIGWDTQDAGGGMDYTLFTLEGQGVAGLMPIPPERAANGGPPAWLGYVSVDDVDAAIAKLKQHGGALLRDPVTVPETIRFAVVADPHGAAFYLATPLSTSPPPALPPGTPGTVGWRELMAGEGEAAFAFYEAMFGWTKGERYEMGPMGAYQLFVTGGVPVGGMMTKPAAIPRPVWSYYFNVPAVDAAASRVTAAGGTVKMGPTEVPGGLWIVQCADPQGAHFGLLAPIR